MFKITETFRKDDNALNLVDLLNKYIKKIIVDYPNLEIYFKFSSNIDNSLKSTKKNERDNSFVCLARLTLPFAKNTSLYL